ncbi:MAG: zinc metallopeptidase [Oscillospiraceae bacterium]|nr:zinc metallopeptidase [Oscillospiraceae bacterium]
MFYWDSTYILVLIGALISAWAALNVRSSFRRYSDVYSSRGITANEAAERILSLAGIRDVRIERISGSLTDHYSPNEKVLRLSDSVYGSRSVAAIGVAAHECGHAIQHAVGYGPLKLRSLAVPIANIGSRLAWPIILIGLVLGFVGLARVGVFLFAFVVIFQLITLPVEFNASRRAVSILDGSGILMGEELVGAKKVLRAAALTYVASLLSAILQLLRLVLLTRGGKRR